MERRNRVGHLGRPALLPDGSGPPVVWAHGMYDDGRRWIPLGSDLADDHEVVAYDARGHGRSSPPETGYNIDDRVADMAGVLTELDLEDPVLVGHSMGAATAAFLAADRPDLAGRFVVVDPARFRDRPDVDPERTREVTRQRRRESSERTIAERFERQFDDVDRDAEHLRRLASAVDQCRPHIGKIAQEHPPVTEAIDERTCPTLVLRRDLSIPDRVEDTEGVRLVHVPDAGHYVFLKEYRAAGTELQTVLRRL